jgi:hypothetical protein
VKISAKDFLIAEFKKDRYYARGDLWDAYFAAGYESNKEFISILEELQVEKVIAPIVAPIGRTGQWYRALDALDWAEEVHKRTGASKSVCRRLVVQTGSLEKSVEILEKK